MTITTITSGLIDTVSLPSKVKRAYYKFIVNRRIWMESSYGKVGGEICSSFIMALWKRPPSLLHFPRKNIATHSTAFALQMTQRHSYLRSQECEN
jgi:hypothetical protein